MRIFGFTAVFWLLGFALPVLAQSRITGISPAKGGPGTIVTLFGTGLGLHVGDSASFFPNVPATILGASASQISVLVPAAAQSGPIEVLIGGFPVDSPDFQVTPRITSFYSALGQDGLPASPAIATVGSTVRIDGFNLSELNGAPPAIYFNGVLGSDISAPASTQASAVVPPGASTGFVTLTTSAGTVSSTTYLYLNPVIASFTAATNAGSVIQIYGSSFLGVSSVSIGGIPATFTVDPMGTNIQATVPTNAVDGPILVASPGGVFLTQTRYYVLPKIDTISPQGGPAGTVVTLQGSGLTGATSVKFGTTPALFTPINSTTLTAIAPVGFTGAPVSVTTPNGSATSPVFFDPPPSISSFSPTEGQPGTIVTVFGQNFNDVSQLALGNLILSTYTVSSDHTQITVVLPANAASGRWRVVTAGGTNLSSASFSVLGPQPKIVGFSPTAGPVGTVITVSGLNLTSATSTTVGGVTAPFAVSGANLTITVPAGAITGPIRVVTPDGTATSDGVFTVGTSADLRATLNSSLNPAVAYLPLTFTYSVNNLGPLPAANVVVTLILPSGVTFLSVQGTADFDRIGNQITLRHGTLNSGSSVNGSVRVKVGAPATLTTSINVTSDTPIPSGGKNQASLTLNAALPSLEIDPAGPGTLSLQWPSAATNFVLEATPSLLGAAPGGSPVWSSVTNLPSDDGFTRQLVLPLGSGADFFRLRLLGSQ
jgi:uncharacterized repeat protein (TIGR01451 family)